MVPGIQPQHQFIRAQRLFVQIHGPVSVHGDAREIGFCFEGRRGGRRQVHLDAFQVDHAQAHQHETGEEKEHNVDQRDDLNPRI